MKLTFRYKGGAGSGFHGHAGRPGEVGGSTSEGSNSGEMSFNEASDFVLNNWEHQPWVEPVHSDYDTITSVTNFPTFTLEMPEGGIAKLFVYNERYVTGKYVAGTVDQNRYRSNVEVRTYRPSTRNPGKMDRWGSKEIVKYVSKKYNDPAVLKKLQSWFKRNMKTREDM